MHARTRSRLAIGVAVALLLGVSLAHAEPEKTEVRYRLTIESDLKVELAAQTIKGTVDTTVDYTWQRQAREGTVIIDALGIRVTRDGKEYMNIFMSKDRITTLKNGEVESDVGPDKMTDEQQKMVKACFGPPLCKFQLDKEGKELKRMPTTDPNAKLLIEQGVVATTRFFHPPFPEDKAKWQAPNEMSMGNGGVARGDLTYEKQEAAEDADQVKVKLSGVLTNKEYKLPNGDAIANAIYQVTGEQTWDRKNKKWVNGKVNLNVTFEHFVQGMKIATSTVTMKLTLAPPPEKK